ncbi:Frag1/DRAM/Sfk1 [Tricharina praecox]|uniref:Frag1/DRAM/Sfk1 n=1 Tax=Tricharina praecox TaxID=43433 RepID=UPI00221FADF5|nr:Frag1/DRAM/Sfk1 [Tricharina praecox]KAI5850001.1 Frag1/DRAM/Sfk1 [Tricharina praecox]
MLWVMIIVWLAQGQPKYASMAGRQRIAYISDIGADVLKPLFVTGSSLTGIFFFASLLSMRRNHALIRRLERTLDMLSLLAGLLGAVCLILLAVFDTQRHPSLHRLFLFLFMLGVVLSALFTTIEYRRLGRTFTQHPMLGRSYRFKQGIVIVEVALSVAFGVTMYRKLHDTAAILEWLIAFVFTFYVLSFFFDLRPTARTKEEVRHDMREARHDIQQAQATSGSSENGLTSASRV